MEIKKIFLLFIFGLFFISLVYGSTVIINQRLVADRIESDQYCNKAGRCIPANHLGGPPGTIVMWSGSIGDIPEGWALCDGTQGTPDLRGKFIVGYHPTDTDYNAVGKTGGFKEIALTEEQLPAHSHRVLGNTGLGGAHSGSGHTGQGGAHSGSGHTGSAGGFSRSVLTSGTSHSRRCGGGCSSVVVLTTGTISVSSHSHSFSFSVPNHQHPFSFTVPAHTHPIDFLSQETGDGEPHENRPPYYTIAFIMRLP
ncbi:MAG: hypothetical protein ACMXYG_02795 [Candidatus Woesearchaeota archaeon]